MPSPGLLSWAEASGAAKMAAHSPNGSAYNNGADDAVEAASAAADVVVLDEALQAPSSSVSIRERDTPRASSDTSETGLYTPSRTPEFRTRSGRRYFTREEVARHNRIDDCWLIAHGRVYDVTQFVHRHPAGWKAIMRHAGSDSTVDFDFHSSSARKLWTPLHVGYVEGEASSCCLS